MTTWTSLTNPAFTFDLPTLGQYWDQLHAGDCEPLPVEPALQWGWAHFHNGYFQEAYLAGLQAGAAGCTLAAKAACIYADYLEASERQRLELFQQVSLHCTNLLKTHTEVSNAHYWHALSLHRYSQGFSVSKVLAQGLDTKIRESLEMAIRLQPTHADANVALGLFYAEIIDKVGPLVASMTYGVSKDACLEYLRRGLALTPDAPGVLMDYANALLMLEEQEHAAEAARCYEKVAAHTPRDAAEHLQVHQAKAEISA